MMKIWKYMMLFAAAVAIAPLTACDDNDEVDPYSINLAYMYQPESTFANVEYKANGEFLIDVDDPLTLMPVRLTKPAPEDVTVEVCVDPAMVDEYNQANGTDYVLLSGATIVNPTLSIAKGEYITPEAVVVNLGDHQQFQSGDVNYIVPVAIKSAGPATVSKSGRIFLTFTSTYRANFVKANSKTYSVITTVDGWETAFKNLTVENFVTTLWPADEAISLKVEIDNSKIQLYNVLNGTGYNPIEATLSTNTLNIAAGGSSADLSLSIGDYSNIDNEEYIIPVVVSVVSGNGAEVKEAEAVGYVIVGGIPPTVSFSRTAPSGITAITPGDNWTFTAKDNNGNDMDGKIVLKSNNTTNFTLDAGYVVTLDMGEAKLITAFAPKYQAYYYGPRALTNIQTSVNGDTWTDWGDAENGGASVMTRYYVLSKPAKARYVRYTVGSRWMSSYAIRLRTFTVYE